MSIKSSTFPLWAVMTTVLIACLSVGAQTGAAGRPDLSGQWHLNPRLSDDAQAMFANMGGGGGHHGAGHGGMEEIRNLMVNAPNEFVLIEDDHRIVVTETNGHTRTLPTNNSVVKIDGRDARTRWENNRLVSETAIENRTLVETYERSPDGHQLIVTVGTEMHGEQMSVRRVYDPVRK